MEDPGLSLTARQHAPYGDDDLISQMTMEMVDAGCAIMQIHRFGDTDFDHARELLRLLAPASNARIIDIGCGVGTIAELMMQIRPDLRFTLLNVSRSQLDMCPAGLEKLHGDMEMIPAASYRFDAALMLYSLGHGHLDTVLSEAARVLRPGGVLMIFDLTGGADLTRSLGYVVRKAEDVTQAAEGCGFTDWTVCFPTNTSVESARRVLGSGIEIFVGLTPVLYRFVKGQSGARSYP